MNDHNLDDLIIGDPEPGGGKSKSLLSLIALVLIILIVGVLLAKLIFSGPEEIEEEAAPTELTGLVKPKAKTKRSSETTPKARPAEKIPDELKPITRETLPESEDLKPIVPKPTPKPAVKPKSTEKNTVPSAPKKPVAKTSKPKPRPKPADLFEKKPKPQKTTPSTGKSYYIQLGSFKRMPDQKFLDKIKANGYEPIIVKSGNMIKVRIGTYGSYGDAKAKLPEVKEKLGIDGFVVRKK